MAEDNKQAAKNAAKSALELKKQKKKKWCPIVAPEIFSNKVIGESLVDDASMLMNKTVTVNLMQLMGDMKKQNINLMFKVTDVKEGKGFTQAVKFEISPSSVKRLTKREKDKLTDSFVVKTADGKLVRIKPVMITNSHTKSSVLAALIKNCRAVCKEIVNKNKFDTLINDLVYYKFQKEVRDAMHKTHPLRNFDIRVFELELKKKKETVEEELLLKLKKQKEAAELEAAEESEEEAKETKPALEDSTEDAEDSDDESEDSEEDEE